MSRLYPFLVIVADKFEAEQVVDLIKSESCVILCLSLDAEFYIKNVLGSYHNRLYEFIDEKNTIAVYKYAPSNFDLVYGFSDDEYWQFIRDRYSYFLTEIDRSLDIADRAIKKIKPSKIILGELANYKGSSVIDGNLKKDAFMLMSKYYSIPYKFLKSQKTSKTHIQILGEIIHFARSLKKQSLEDKVDLLIVATPRHIIHMGSLIKQISANVHVSVITYSLTVELKKGLDKLGIKYLEKERLLNGNLRKLSKQIKTVVLRKKLWKSFILPKFDKNIYITKYIRNKLKGIFENELEEIVLDFSSARQLISKTKPKMLLTTTDPDTKVLTYILAANDMGVKTMCIQHGIFFPTDPPSSAPQSKYFVTWSKLSKNTLSLNPHFKKVNILIGQSPFHHLLAKHTIHKKKVKRTILFLAAIDILDSTLKNYYLLKLFQCLDNLSQDFELLIRTHPFQNRKNLEAIVANTKIHTIFDNNVNIADSLAASDIVIFENTTAGLDSMLAGLPCIYFNPYSGTDFLKVSEYNAAMTILNEENMLENLYQFLTKSHIWPGYGQRGKTFARRYLGLNGSDNKNQLFKVLLDNIKTYDKKI